MKADLTRGWRRLEKTFGFFRQMWIWYRGDFHVRTMLTLLMQPATFNKSAAEFPDITLQGGNELTNYRVAQKMLTLKIAVKEGQPWRLMMGKRPGIFFQDLGLPVDQGLIDHPSPASILTRWLDLRAWVVFHPPDRRPIPDVRVWCQRLFVPAGQFESNRRKH